MNSSPGFLDQPLIDCWNALCALADRIESRLTSTDDDPDLDVAAALELVHRIDLARNAVVHCVPTAWQVEDPRWLEHAFVGRDAA